MSLKAREEVNKNWNNKLDDESRTDSRTNVEPTSTSSNEESSSKANFKVNNL